METKIGDRKKEGKKMVRMTDRKASVKRGKEKQTGIQDRKMGGKKDKDNQRDRQIERERDFLLNLSDDF